MRRKQQNPIIQRTIDRIKELDIAITKAELDKNKAMVALLRLTRTSNYRIYLIYTGQVYDGDEALIQ